MVLGRLNADPEHDGDLFVGEVVVSVERERYSLPFRKALDRTLKSALEIGEEEGIIRARRAHRVFALAPWRPPPAVACVGGIYGLIANGSVEVGAWRRLKYDDLAPFPNAQEYLLDDISRLVASVDILRREAAELFVVAKKDVSKFVLVARVERVMPRLFAGEARRLRGPRHAEVAV